MTDTQKTLPEVLADLWAARSWVAGGLALGVLCALAFILVAVPHYRAQLILSPANPMNGAEVSSLLADDNLFALRYLAQRVGVSNSTDYMRFETTYAGPTVAEVLLRDEGVRLGLAQDKSFRFSRAQMEWTSADLAEYIKDRVRIGDVGTTTLRRMSYDHPRPEFAAYFLYHIHRVADELIRLNVRRAATQRVQYLQDTIAKTVNPEHKRALTTLLMEQERLRMLVSIESPYAATVIEPPAALPKAAWPDRALVFVLFILAGAVAGFAFHGVRAGLRAQEGPAGKVSHRKKRWYKDNNLNSNEKPDEEDKIAAAE